MGQNGLGGVGCEELHADASMLRFHGDIQVGQSGGHVGLELSGEASAGDAHP